MMFCRTFSSFGCVAPSACSPRSSFRRASLFLFCATFFAFALGIPAASHAQQLQILHNHVRTEVSGRRAALFGTMPLDQQIHASIVLPLRNQAALTGLLARLYDPTSPDYRHFLTVAQFTDQFGPTSEDFQSVVDFAQANGLTVTDRPPNRLIVPISGAAAQMNAAFHIQMNVYQHPTESRNFFSPDREPSLDLSVPVAHISGLDDFSLPHPMSVRAPLTQQPAVVQGSGPGGAYLGSDMRAAYYGGTTLDGNGQAIGLVEFGGYSLSDVNLTFSNAGQTYTVPVNNVLLDGAPGTPSAPYGDAEEVLDIVQAIGMAPNLSQVRVYIGQGNDDPSILNSMASENIAKQLSCSWGWRPADPSVDDVFFQEMAAQGQSFFASSGDDGAFDAAISPFFYPAEDQYVTTVGGTHLTTSGAGGVWVSEVAWNSQGSGTGGGISPDGITIPSWQVGLATTANGGSTTLRNVPDVAMEGDFDNYACASGSCYGDYAGTSFSAPRWAGFMALVNQQAVESGNAPAGGVGFINPAIYRLAQGTNASADFHDITSGNNNTANQPLWFSAVAGYDLTTGWGSATGQHLIDDLAGPQVPGFWLASTKSTVGINPGSTATTTFNITDAGGFSDNVTLSVTSALPTGVTASFSPNPTTGSSVLTLTAAATAPSANQAVTITGTAGTLTASTNVTVAVHAPNFTLSSSPSTLGINQGASGTSTVTVLPLYGFTDAVSLTISGLPAGVTASFSPTSTTGTSTLTLNVGSAAVPGNSTLTVTGTSGNLTATTNVSLSIQGPSFTLSSTSSVNIGQGASGTAYVYVYDQYGFTGNVNLAFSGLPAGVTATFATNPTTNSSVLTFSASSSTVVGSSVITITGTSGQLTATTTVTLGVFAPTFTLSGNNTLSIGQGNSATSYVYINPQFGFTGNVTLSVAGLPTGVTALWTPNPATSYSNLILSVSASAKIGQYPLTITGVSGSITQTINVTLGVYAPTFTLSTYSGLSLGQGTTASAYVYINPQYGFTGSVNLAVSGLPAGVTGAFSTNPATGSSNLTLTASSTAAVGQYTATITGTSGSITQTTTLTFGIFTPTFTLSNYGNISVGQGASSYGYVYVNAQYGFAGSVNMSVSGLPAGVTASFSPNPATSSGLSTLTVNASSAAAVGQYTLTVTGTSGAQTQTTTVTLGIFKPTFTLSSYGSVNLGQGTSASTSLSINAQYGFTGAVTLAVSGLPTGVTAAFSPNPTTGSSTLTFTASSTATLGQATVTVTGTSGSSTSAITIPIGVYVPAFTLSAYSVTGAQGTSISDSIYVNAQYGFAGGVTLSVSGLPAGVTGSFTTNPTTYSSSLLLNISASAALGTSTVTVTGTSGSQVVSTTFPLSIVAPSFTLSSSYSVTLNEGASGTAYVYVYGQNGFTGNITLSVSGLPSGVTASFSPNPTTYSSVLTLTASSTATPGTATITVNGVSGSVTASTTMQVTINAPSFALTAAPPDVFLTPGASQKSTIAIVPTFGFTGAVSYVATGLPAGVTASFSANPTASATTLTLTAAATATPVSGTVIITGTSGSLSATTTILVTVRKSATASATALTFTAGGKSVSTITAPTLVTATATVTSGSTPLTIGQVNFCYATATLCDAVHLIGSAQLTNAGTAVFQFIPGAGNQSYKAIFVGTTTNSSSVSAPASLSVTATQASKTTIAQSGTAGNYKLTATVTAQGPLAPTGTVSFLDATAGNSNLGSGTLASNPAALALNLTQSPTVGSQPRAIATGDFNSDGIPDLAVANGGASSVSILLGNGDGTFTAAASLTTGSNPIAIAAGDFNRDGRLDLAVLLNGSSSVNVFLSNGDGTFTPSTSSPQTGNSPVSMALGDYNGDGLLDLAVVNGGNSTLTVLLGNGDGTFTPFALSPSLASQSSAIAQGDFNGDGVQDLAVANVYGGSITILLGAGDGSFGSIGTVPTTGYASSIAIADLNNDGKLDLVVGSQSNSTVNVLLGNGDGTFTAAASPYLGNDPSPVVVADLNGDGNADIIAANYYNSTISVALGNGDGTFATATNISAGSYPVSLALGDWNGDGIKDIVAANNSSNTLSVITSQLTQKATASALAISPVGQGAHAVNASYGGDSYYAGSVSATTNLTAAVGAPVVKVTLSPTSISTAQALTATVTVSGGGSNPVATGTVKISSGSYTSAPITLSNGSAFITIPAGTLPVGTDSLSTSYTPDAASSSTYTTATGTASIAITKATPSVTLTIAPTPVTFAQSVTVTIAVNGGSGAPTASGTVMLSSGSYTSTVATLSNGSAAILIPAGTLPVGTDSLAVSFTPDSTGAAIYTGATSSGSVTISSAVTDLAWSAPASITYGTALSNAQLNASSSLTGSFSYSPVAGTVLAAGTQILSVTFTPKDTNYPVATSTVSLTVNKAPLSLTATNAARLYGAANPAFNGTVTGPVNGDTFTEAFTSTAVASSTAGTYPIVPIVAGANLANYTVTTTNGVLTISPASATTSLILSNGNLTFTATVVPATSGIPTGNVSFYAGQTLLGTGALTNGVASYTATTFPAGDVSLSAQYSGDANFTQSASSSTLVLTTTMSSTSLTVTQSGTASIPLTFAVAQGYSGTLQFSCNNLPQNANCSFVPSSVSFSGSTNSAASTLTIHTGGVAALTLPANPFSSSRPTTWAAILGLPGLLALGFAGGRRKLKLALRTIAMLLLLCSAASSLVACAGASSPNSTPTPVVTSTPSGNYTIQIVASGSSAVTQTTNLSVTVQ